MYSAEGRNETHTYEIQADGTTVSTHVAADGAKTVIARRTDNSVTITTPDGTVINEERETDPRPQLGLDYLSRREIKVPGLPTYLLNRVRTILPADAADASQVTNVTDLVAINGGTFTNTLDLITHALTARTPEGRVRVVQTDAFGRVISDQTPGLGQRTFSYDARGHLTNRTLTVGGETAALNLRYDALGRLTNVVAPEGFASSYFYDSGNQPSSSVLPGGQSVGFEVDSEGNLTGLTPPGRPTHHFTFDARNFPLTNNPPVLVSGPTPQSAEFNLDRSLRRLSIPGARSIDLAYNALGQLTNASYSTATLSLPATTPPTAC